MLPQPTPPDLEELRVELQTLSPEDFTNYKLLDRDPWIFASRESYGKWKQALGAEIEVDPYYLIVVGSACVGRSLAPHKALSPFSDNSDVDVAVVSARHFDEAW